MNYNVKILTDLAVFTRAAPTNSTVLPGTAQGALRARLLRLVLPLFFFAAQVILGLCFSVIYIFSGHS